VLVASLGWLHVPELQAVVVAAADHPVFFQLLEDEVPFGLKTVPFEL
jgi:hypothetical protein